MIRRALLFLLALVLAAGGVACGGDDDSSEDASPDETEAPDDEATTDGDEAPDPSDDASGDAADQFGVDREFTGDGSEPFCTEVGELQDQELAGDAAEIEDAEYAAAMAAITPPDEIAAEWANLHTVLQQMADDTSGDPLGSMSQEELDAWGESGQIVAAYLADVCGLTGGA